MPYSILLMLLFSILIEDSRSAIVFTMPPDIQIDTKFFFFPGNSTAAMTFSSAFTNTPEVVVSKQNIIVECPSFLNDSSREHFV